MAKHAKSSDSKILDRIRRHRHGWVFTPAHLADLGTRNAIGSALKRFKASGTIRQLARGLYDYPIHDPVLGMVAPSADAIAAIARALESRRLLVQAGCLGSWPARWLPRCACCENGCQESVRTYSGKLRPRIGSHPRA